MLKEENIPLTPDQWVMLEAIKELDEPHQKELASHLRKDPASVKRTIDILEKQRLLIRSKHPGDKRAFRLVLTPEGKDLMHRLFPLMIDFEAQGVKGLNMEEMELFERILKRITENYS